MNLTHKMCICYVRLSTQKKSYSHFLNLLIKDGNIVNLVAGKESYNVTLDKNES